MYKGINSRLGSNDCANLFWAVSSSSKLTWYIGRKSTIVMQSVENCSTVYPLLKQIAFAKRWLQLQILNHEKPSYLFKSKWLTFNTDWGNRIWHFWNTSFHRNTEVKQHWATWMVDHMRTTHSTQRAVSTVRWVQILMLLGGVNLASSPIRGWLSLGISGRVNI